ncbi:hypothetical protein D041_4268B, partial [Vibrio parahaemolyticus EKP-008]
FTLAHNATLSSEQRYHQTKHYHLKHKTQRLTLKMPSVGNLT